MKFNFGKTSRANLATIGPELQEVFRDALATGIMDFSITDITYSENQKSSGQIVNTIRCQARQEMQPHISMAKYPGINSTAVFWQA